MFERTYVGSFYKETKNSITPRVGARGPRKQLFLNFQVHFTGKRHIVEFFGLQIRIWHTRIREEKLLRGSGINVA